MLTYTMNRFSNVDRSYIGSGYLESRESQIDSDISSSIQIPLYSDDPILND